MINKNLVKYYKNLLLNISLDGNDKGNECIETFTELLTNPESYKYSTFNKIEDGEYIYTIDFGTCKFIANKHGKNIYSFNLFDIPFDWYEVTQKHSSYYDTV
jgi:hypothetical protein